MKLMIINGPNLNLLGKREPSIYGKVDFQTYLERLQMEYNDVSIHYYQSNHEGDIIDKIQEVGFSYNGIILNAGALSHTSIAIADAISAIESPVVEVHISNVFARESYRHHSWLSGKCVGSIIGFGLTGYDMAIDFFIKG